MCILFTSDTVLFLYLCGYSTLWENDEDLNILISIISLLHFIYAEALVLEIAEHFFLFMSKLITQ